MFTFLCVFYVFAHFFLPLFAFTGLIFLNHVDRLKRCAALLGTAEGKETQPISTSLPLASVQEWIEEEVQI